MMKQLVLSFVSSAVLLTVGAMTSFSGDMENMHKKGEMKAAEKTMEVQGEIVDLGCYLGHGAKGADHQSCALKCVANGMPMGLLTKDGSLYLLTVSHENADPFNQAKKWAAEQVIVSGPILERDGMKALEVDKVTQAPMKTSSK